MAVIMASQLLFYVSRSKLEEHRLGMHFETRNSRGQHAKSSGCKQTTLSSIFLATQYEIPLNIKTKLLEQ